MTIRLRLLPSAEDSATPCDVRGVVPGAARAADFGQLPIFVGRHRLRLDSIFSVHVHEDEKASDATVVWEGDLKHVHFIGCGMNGGTMRVEGSTGHFGGQDMRNGRLVIGGDVGHGVGVGMRGGSLIVQGNAGDRLGSHRPGKHRGMEGGTIVVHGSVGRRAGSGMRRGLIAVGGDCGDHAMANMLAGTLVVRGRLGRQPGANMRRGTLIGLSGLPVTGTLPTFRYGCTTSFPFWPLLRNRLEQEGMSKLPAATRRFALYHGDFLAGGRGELLITEAHQAATC